MPIMSVLQLPMKESFKTWVSLLPLKGVWFLFWSSALMHSFRARRDWLICAPSILSERIGVEWRLPGLLAGVGHVSSSFAACEIDEAEFAFEFVVLGEVDLEDGMRATGVCVGTVLSYHPVGVAFIDHVHEVVDVLDDLLAEADDVDGAFGVFAGVEEVLGVEEVVELLAVDLVEGHSHVEVLGQVGEEVVGCEQVEPGHGLVAKHGVRLARPGLPVGEARDLGALEDGLDHGLEQLHVEFLVGRFFRDGRVEHVVVLLDELGQVHLLSEAI